MTYVDRLFQRSGISIRRHYERDQLLYNRRVRTTDYLAFSSTLSAKFLDYGPQRVFLTLDAPEMRVTHYINHLPNTAQMAELFVDWLKQNYKTLFSFGKTRPSAADASDAP